MGCERLSRGAPGTCPHWHSPVLLTIKDVAAELAATEYQIRDIITSGDLPAMQIGGLSSRAILVSDQQIRVGVVSVINERCFHAAR